MGLDFNEYFDVQINFIWEKESVDFGSEEYFGAEGQESNEIVSLSQWWGWSALSQQDNSMMVYQHNLSDITVINS